MKRIPILALGLLAVLPALAQTTSITDVDNGARQPFIFTREIVLGTTSSSAVE